MIGKLVVVKDNVNICVGEVVAEVGDRVGVEILYVSNNVAPEYIQHIVETNDTYWIQKSNIIKKSSRPVRMKSQLNLEEQQPTTL